MIQRVAFRGIERGASEFVLKDGRAHDCLNVLFENSEIRVMPAPEPIAKVNGKIEMTHNDNYVSFAGGTLTIYGKDFTTINTIDLGDGVEVIGVNKVGNIITVSTNVGMKYVLFTEGEYKLFDPDSIRMEIEYRTADPSDSVLEKDDCEYKLTRLVSDKGFVSFVVKKKESDDVYEVPVVDGKWEDAMHTAINIGYDTCAKLGYFCQPLVVMSAVRMFDGSIINQSELHLMEEYKNSGSGANCGVFLTTRYDGSKPVNIAIHVKCYKVLASIKKNTAMMSDLIEGIDFFACRINDHKQEGNNFCSVLFTPPPTGEYICKLRTAEFMNSDEIMNQITNLQGLFFISSFKKTTFENNITNYSVELNENRLNTSLIGSYEAAKLTSNPDMKFVPAGQFVYNSRLHLFNAKLIFTGECMDVKSTKVSTSSNSTYGTTLRRVFKVAHIKVNNKVVKVCRVVFTNDTDGVVRDSLTLPRLISFPDSRAFKVDFIEVSQTGDSYSLYKYSFSLTAMVSLDYSAALNFTYVSPSTESVSDEGCLDTSYYEDVVYDVGDTLYVSEVNNPLVFPVVNEWEMPAKLIGLGAITTALSDGQFGAYPLYCFTSDGIWALSVSGGSSAVTESGMPGTYNSLTPVSRDVCNNASSITPIDGAILFSSKKGLMAIAGSNVSLLTPLMQGEPVHALGNCLSINNEFAIKITYLSFSIMEFHDFLSEATFMYDYRSSIVLMARPGLDFAYAIDMAGKNVTKVQIDFSSKFSDYPSDYYQDKDGNIYKVDTKEGVDRTGYIMIESAFGDATTLKSMYRIFVRGKFNKENIGVAVFGSRDGEIYTLLNSLRGIGYKSFRIAVFFKEGFTKKDRATFVECDMQPRQVNRLR